MAHTTHGVGGLAFDKSRRTWPPEMNIFIALIVIAATFEILGRLLIGNSFLFNTRENVDAIFNQQRLEIIILQVSIVGIIAIGVTQVIITGGIDLSSGSVVGATAMIAMSFAQVAIVNGNPNPKAIFPEQGWLDLPVIVPILVGLGCGLIAGLINGSLIAYTKIPPFIATLGMMVTARGVANWYTRGQPVSFPTESYAALGRGMTPVFVFIAVAIIFQVLLKYTVYGRRTYAIGSNEQAARVSGINVEHHLMLVYTIAGLLAGLAGIVLAARLDSVQPSSGLGYELDTIAAVVIGGASLNGGIGSIGGTAIGVLIIGVLRNGLNLLGVSPFIQQVVIGVVIALAVAAATWRRRTR